VLFRSICRALKIYSIEALHAVDGHQVKALGMNANELKRMARRYMEDRAKKAATKTADDVEALKAEVERLRALIPAQETPPEEIDALVQAADDEYADLTTEGLKERIANLTGARPRGNPSRQTLVQSLRELEGAA